MSAKSLKIQNRKMFWAAIFVLFAVGIYANVEEWLVKRVATDYVLGQKTSLATKFDLNRIWKKIVGRVIYGRSYDSVGENNR